MDAGAEVPVDRSGDTVKTKLTYNKIDLLIDNINKLHAASSADAPSDLKVYFAYADWTKPPAKDSIEKQKIPLSKKENLDNMINELNKICPDNAKANQETNAQAANSTKSYYTLYDSTNDCVTEYNSYSYSTCTTYYDSDTADATYYDGTKSDSTCTTNSEKAYTTTSKSKGVCKTKTNTTKYNINCQQYSQTATNSTKCIDNSDWGTMQWCEDTCHNRAAHNKLYQGKVNSTYATYSTDTTNNKSVCTTNTTNSEGTGDGKTVDAIYLDSTAGNSQTAYRTKTYSDEVGKTTNTTCKTRANTTDYCSETPNTTITNTTVRLEYVVKNGQKISCENYDYNYIPEKTD